MTLPMRAIEEKLYKKRILFAAFYGMMLGFCIICAVEDYIGGAGGAKAFCAYVMSHWVPWEKGIWIYGPAAWIFTFLLVRLNRI